MLKLTLALLLVSTQAQAAGDGIPTHLITVQLVNVLIFLGLLVYFLRPIVKSYFSNRKTEYVTTVSKAEDLKKEADQQKAEIESKIANFKKEAALEIEKAKSEAEELKAKIIQQGDDLSETIKTEAQKTIQNELEKAKNELKASILEQSLNAARDKFSTQLNADDHKKMNKSFVESVGAN